MLVHLDATHLADQTPAKAFATMPSRLRTHSQNMKVAAMQLALMNGWAQRSKRVAILRQSLSLPNMRSIRLRCL
jgi:hypothetical protein